MARCTPASHLDTWCSEVDIGMVRGIAGMCVEILEALSSGFGGNCWRDLRGGSCLHRIFGLRELIFYTSVSGLFDELQDELT